MNNFYEPDKVKQEVPMEPIPDEVRALYLRPGELLAIQERFPVAYQPLGTVEWHGRHNPLGCDSFKAEQLCMDAAKLTGGVVMPTIHFGVDPCRDLGHGMGMGMDAAAGFQLPGTFFQTESGLLRSFLLNACRNYLNRGFRLVVLVSGHNPSDQQSLMNEICYAMKTPDGREPVCCTMEYAVIEPGNPHRQADHAAGYETSMMLHLHGDRVNMRANDEQLRPDLGVDGRMPVNESTAAEGKICFNLQIAGLAKFAREKLANLR